MDLVNGTLVDKDETLANNSTVDPNADVGHHGLVYVLVPILAVTAILILIAGAFCFSRRRETQRLRQQFVPMYSVEHEENEWGSQLVEEDSSRHLHIVKPDRRSQARMLLERSSPL